MNLWMFVWMDQKHSNYSVNSGLRPKQGPYDFSSYVGTVYTYRGLHFPPNYLWIPFIKTCPRLATILHAATATLTLWGKNGGKQRHNGRSNLNRFRRLTLFSSPFSARWSLTNTKFLFSPSILGIFLQFSHQNCCSLRACFKNAIKMTIGATQVVLTYVPTGLPTGNWTSNASTYFLLINYY